MSKYKLDASKLNAEDVTNFFKKKWTEDLNAQIQSEGKIQIGKVSASYFTIPHMYKETPIIGKFYVIKDGASSCFIGAISAQDSFETYEPIIDKSVQSFRFK